MSPEEGTTERSGTQFTRESVLRDYRIAFRSRSASILGRREVLTGKAKFGIFGDGKEVAQIAMARAFREGDWRAGYYRDQTFMMALGLLSVEEFFAQLYGDTEPGRDPASGGRQMNCHFATRLVSEDGSWLQQAGSFNSSADLSPTGSQMPRLVGLAYASRLYRELEGLTEASRFSDRGNEIAFGTIGDASCAEGMFWEAINAAGALRAPMLLSIWDDAYGISVPTEFHITKGHLSSILRGFQRAPGEDEGFDIYTVRGWDYPVLCETYLLAAEIVRREHVPAIIHVTQLTQPQGHSTSGSQERYKSEERLAWEREFDCVTQMRRWMERSDVATTDELDEVEAEEWKEAAAAKQRAWEAYRAPLEERRSALTGLLQRLEEERGEGGELAAIRGRIERAPDPPVRDLQAAAQEALVEVRGEGLDSARALAAWMQEEGSEWARRYGSHLVSDGALGALQVRGEAAAYAEDSPTVNGFEILNAFFDRALARYPELVIFGEDVGRLGDVNQGLAGLQEKYGDLRVADTGIREMTILGQAIGLAERGLRPIAEIQYLDYLLYCLQIMSDDLATLRWRTAGGQKAPVIVRTRGHRLEGIWHSGSPMAGIIHLVRGVHVCVPRDMVQAAGFYGTLLRSDDPGLVIEVLNGYRKKERLPANIGDLALPLGVPEVLRPGSDITVVTYGACCRIALEAAELLSRVGIDSEVIDVQTLLPFDREGRIVRSLERTGRVLFLDEDVPGGASATMMQQVLEGQGGYQWLDSAPVTVTARPHRPAYGSDGDYFSKPNREQVFDSVYGLMGEADPKRFPPLRPS